MKNGWRWTVKFACDGCDTHLYVMPIAHSAGLMRPKLCLKLRRMARIEDDPTYKHLTGQRVPHDAAWTAAWIDRAYHHLVNNGMEAEDAYALAKSSFHANSFDLVTLTPETFITEVFIAGFKAQS